MEINTNTTTTKKCITCEISKTLDEFKTRTRNGKMEYLGRCRTCENKRIKEWKQSKAKEKKEEKLAEMGINEEIPEGSKHCTKCKKVKKLEEFGKYKKENKEYYNSRCFECLKNKLVIIEMPCSLFDLEDPKEQLKCFNWRNLRPLEAKKNLSKGNKKITRDIFHQELKVKYYLEHVLNS